MYVHVCGCVRACGCGVVRVMRFVWCGVDEDILFQLLVVDRTVNIEIRVHHSKKTGEHVLLS